MKAIILSRVSSLVQNYEAQTKDLLEYANKKGYNDIHIIETKETGLSNIENKKGSNEMIKFIEENPDYKTVFATEMSRLGRRQSVLHTYREWLIKNKVQFYLKDSNFSLFDEMGNVTPSGELMFTFYGYFAEQEIKQKKERFARSKRMLFESGYSISGRTLFGYDRVMTDLKKTTLVENKTNADIVRTIYNWYLYGIDKIIKNPSIRIITLECIKRGYPNYTHSKRNVNKLLKEEGYTGFKITNNKRKNPEFTNDNTAEKYIVVNYKIKYPQIIDQETFDLVQAKLLTNNTNVEKSSKHITLLAKLIKCQVCGNHYNANYRIIGKVNKSVYRCSSRSSAKPCGNTKSISMQMIDSAIWSLIKSDLELLAEQININDPDITAIKTQQYLEALEDKLEELQNDYENELKTVESVKKNKNIDITSFLARFEQSTSKIDKEIGNIKKEITRGKLLLNVQQTDNHDIVNVINKNLDKIENSKSLLKDYINLFVESISVLYHTKRHSIFKINFNLFSSLISESDIIIQDNVKQTNSLLGDLYRFNIEYDTSIPNIGKQTTLLIDKNQTLKIKLYKSTSFGYNLLNEKELKELGFTEEVYKDFWWLISTLQKLEFQKLNL
jgi:DNA invertase Pin-like site-specific DNA recombinase